MCIYTLSDIFLVALTFRMCHYNITPKDCISMCLSVRLFPCVILCRERLRSVPKSLGILSIWWTFSNAIGKKIRSPCSLVSVHFSYSISNPFGTLNISLIWSKPKMRKLIPLRTLLKILNTNWTNMNNIQGGKLCDSRVLKGMTKRTQTISSPQYATMSSKSTHHYNHLISHVPIDQETPRKSRIDKFWLNSPPTTSATRSYGQGRN